MASKEATVYIIDVGASMGNKSSGRDVTDLDWALEYLWDKITTTVATDRKTAHMAVVGLKTDDSDNSMYAEDESYEHISVFAPLGQMVMPNLRELKKKLVTSSTDTGDALSALVLAIDMINKHTKKLQYTRRIVLITNGLTPFDEDGVDPIIDQIKDCNIEVAILGVDFDDAEFGSKEEDKPQHKADVERALKDIADKCEGMYGTLAQAIEELSIPRIKSVRPTPSYKGFLNLGDAEKYDTAMSIDVERYPKVMVAKAPSASSFVIRGDVGTQATQSGGVSDEIQASLAAVKRASTYQVTDEAAPNGIKDVEHEDLAKGYAYGSTAVYISESDLTVTTFETTMGLDIIGFVDKTKYAHYMDMSRSNVIIAARTNDKAVMALSSFIHALYELDSYAIARFVQKANKAPTLLLLCPHISPELECLYDTELPFAEDVRAYRFPPLDRVVTVSGKTLTSHRNLPSAALCDAMDAYVDAMDLSADAAIDDTYSPTLHRVNQAIRHRAVYPSASIPPVPPVLTRWSQPPSELQSAARPALEALRAAADVKKVPPKALAKRGGGGAGGNAKREPPKPLSGLDVNALLNSSGTSGSANGHSSGGGRDLAVVGGKKRIVDLNNAVPSFRQAVQVAEASGSEAGLLDAFAQMGRVIGEIVRDSTGSSGYARAVECIGVLREECVGLEMAEPFNEWAVGFKKDLLEGKLGGDRREAWWSVRVARVRLIGEKEVRGGVGEEESKRWAMAGLV